MFPMTVTIHSSAQLAAVLGAMGGLPSLPGATQGANYVEHIDKKEAAAQVEKSSTSAATTAGAARGQRTAAAGAATAAPEKMAGESSPTAESAAGAPQASTAARDPISYETVAKAITDMVKSNRQKAVDSLAKFGAKKGTDLKPEQYADFLAALEG